MARQNFIGMVISQGKMQKTVKVRVESKVFNHRINKELIRRKDYLVHDEGEVSREGDLVRIESTRPLSKRKFFSIAEIIRNKGQQFALYEQEAKLSIAKEEAAKSKEFLERRAIREQESNSMLLKDIRTIQEALAKGQSPEDLSEIKQRYGIQEFTKDTIKKLLTLDINEAEASIEEQRQKIEGMNNKLMEYLDDTSKADDFLRSHGVESPELLQKNIRKNIIRKHIIQEL